jgi:hypothetical protein
MDVFLLKVVGAALAFGLAVLNLLIMLQLYGKVRLFPWTPESLAWWHRRQGDVILVLFVVIAYHCVKYGYIDPASSRLSSHSSMLPVLNSDDRSPLRGLNRSRPRLASLGQSCGRRWPISWASTVTPRILA